MDVAVKETGSVKHLYPNRPMKNARPRTKAPCKCLTCSKAIREKYEDLTMLVCEDEACFMECDKCTERPVWCKEHVRIPEAAVC